MGKRDKGKDSKKESQYVNIGRISRSRRDGEEIRFKGFDGSKRSGKYAPCANIVAREFGGKFLFSVIFEDGFELNKDEEFYNFYPADGLDLDIDADKIRAARKEFGGKGKKNRRDEEDTSSDDDDADEDDNDDEENPFA